MSPDNVYVRSKDKVILSDLLFYVFNEFHNTPKNVIIETCVNFYDEHTIWNEKVKFFESIHGRATNRRSADRKNKNIDDILTEIALRDCANSFLPVFAAVRLHNMPQAQDGAVSNGQILGNLKFMKKDLLEAFK